MHPFPELGAFPEAGGTLFRVYAPGHGAVVLEIESGERAGEAIPFEGAGLFERLVPGVRAGDRYRYRLDGAGPFPDPASRFQPLGVHGPSEIVDPHAHHWTAHAWRGVRLESLVIYELHVGTFTPEGTFAAAAQRLPHLRDLGVTAVELMPVNDFPGGRNWGYDCAALFAPARCYGTPDDLRRFVDEAHGLGLAVLLDVVYNHLGPDGAYAVAFDRRFLTQRHRSPWGAGVNLDGEGSEGVREFLIQNAEYWIRDFRMDGLRLDATHALPDASGRHLLEELSSRARAVCDREVTVIAEDGRNLNRVLARKQAGGYGLDAEWGFDFHHQFHRLLTGERARYYADFRASLRDLAKIMREGWLFTGQRSKYDAGRPRGTDPAGIPPRRFVFYLQSHDEVGNRPRGERLHRQIGLPAWRAASALLLCAPQTPMLFMGEEWAAGTPFLFFTDHKPGIGRRIIEGRRKSFADWKGFRSAAARERIPDPQAVETFLASRLDWSEPAREPHASMLRFARALIAFRRGEPALGAGDGGAFSVQPLGRRTLLLTRAAPQASPIVVVAQLEGEATVDLAKAELPAARAWRVAFTSEDAAFAPDAEPAGVDFARGRPVIRFHRPGAVLLRGEPD